jgi:hypothetical protein
MDNDTLPQEDAVLGDVAWHYASQWAAPGARVRPSEGRVLAAALHEQLPPTLLADAINACLEELERDAKIEAAAEEVWRGWRALLAAYRSARDAGEDPSGGWWLGPERSQLIDEALAKAGLDPDLVVAEGDGLVETVRDAVEAQLDEIETAWARDRQDEADYRQERQAQYDEQYPVDPAIEAWQVFQAGER